MAAVPVPIYDAESRAQTFDQAAMLVSASSTRRISVRWRATTSGRTPRPRPRVIFGELYQHGGEWKFGAVGQGYASGL